MAVLIFTAALDISEERIDRHRVSFSLVKPLKTEPKKQTYSKTRTILDESGKRKVLEMPGRKYHQDRYWDSNFFGIRDGYLVFHHMATGRLMVADLRPLW